MIKDEYCNLFLNKCEVFILKKSGTSSLSEPTSQIIANHRSL